MKAQVGDLKQSPVGLPSLNSFTYDRTPSPFKKSSHKLITNESMRHSATPHDFIDGHQTFYLGLFQKLKMDVDTKKNSSSVLRDSSPVKSSSKQLANMSAIEPYRSSEINFIEKNIQSLIDKRRTKRFRYLEDDDKIKMAIEPKKLIKGLDELNTKIERTFINRKRDDDYSTRLESRRNLDTTQKTYKSQHSTVSVAMKLDSMPNSYQKGSDSRQPMRVKKRSQTNFTRDHRDRDRDEKGDTFQADAPKGLRLADKMKIADEKIEFSFDKKFKKAPAAQLPYVRSVSQPRPTSRTTEKEAKSSHNSHNNTRSFEQSRIKSTQAKEFNDYEESVSGYMYPEKGSVFRKMLDYIKNNDTEILEFDENREYIHLKPSPEKEKEKPREFRTPSRHESINKGSRNHTEPRKTTIDDLSNLNNHNSSVHNNGSINTLNNLSPGTKKLDLMKAFTEHDLPSRPLIKSLENNAFILENYPINAEMCESIGALLKDKGDVTNISLINNKLNDQALSLLLTPLLSKSAEVSIFRCVKNSFGDFFLGVFEKKFFALGNNTLKELTLDGCKVLQKSLIEVIEVLLGARSRLKYLGLSDIGLNEHSIITLNRFIESSEYLMSLDVSWNKMNNDAVKMLLDNVRLSQSLRSLDLSWNSLGHQDSKLAKLLKEMIVNSPLVHLNLSHTGLNDFDAILIIEGVKLNKNLMSLHLGGNYITVPVIKRLSSHLEAVKKLSDFLPPCIDKVKNRIYSKLHPGYQFSYKNSEVTSTTTSPTKKLGRRDSMVHSSLDDIAEEEEFNQEINNALQLIYYRIIDPDVQENNNVWIESRNCWICERWRKTQVSYTVPKPVENPKNNGNNQGGKRPKNMRNQRLSRDMTDEADSSKLQSGKEDVRISGTFSNNQSIKMTFNKQQRAFEFSDYLPPGVHHYKICWLKGQGSMITTGTQETVDGGSEVLLEGNLSIKPRDTDVKPIRENEEKAEEKKKEFIKERSVFAEFRLDDEISLRKAFELDVRRWKLKDATLKKAEADKILIFLYKKYTTVRSIFMRYAAWNCYPFVSLEGFADCLDECKVYDNDFKRLDAMKVFNHKEAAEDGADGPQTSLSRAEFMEGLLRVAIARVNPKRIADVQAEAVEKFLNDNVFIYALDTRKTYEEFRKLKVHTYEVDALLKLNLDALESIFKKKRHLFGVRVESTKEILAVAGIQITDRDLLWMFSHSKMLIIDEEKDSKKYLVLSFVEFLEFLVRLADFLTEEGPIAQKLATFLEKLLKAHKFNFVPCP